MKTVRILIADDHDVVRHGVRALLEAQPDWEVCGEALNGREAVEKAKELKPDVVLLDITMPELNGLEATQRILKAVPRIEILILTMHESEQMMREVLKAGARGYILKTGAMRDLVPAVNALRQHKPFFTPVVSEILLDRYLKAGSESADQERFRSLLTSREREIVQLLAEGKSNKEVAAALGISVKTVETHRTNIMRKLNLHTISDLVRYAIRNKIVEP